VGVDTTGPAQQAPLCGGCTEQISCVHFPVLGSLKLGLQGHPPFGMSFGSVQDPNSQKAKTEDGLPKKVKNKNKRKE